MINKYRLNKILITLICVFVIESGNAQLSRGLLRLYRGDNIFPTEWLAKNIQASATIPHSDRTFAINEIEKAFGKYPPGFRSWLKGVILVGHLTFLGQKYPSAHSQDNIYIAIRHNPDMEKLFHRELCEMLLKSNSSKFNAQEWKSLYFNSTHFGRGTIRTISFTTRLNPLLFEQGFLTDDSLNSWELDVATYAENLFAGGKQFWQIVDHYPLVKTKTLAVIKFYHALYSIYTENWFRFISDYRLF